MKVLVHRELRKTGMIKKKNEFLLRVRAELTPEEQELIQRCEAGEATLFTWHPSWARELELTMTVDSIVKGQTVSCGHFIELTEAEEEVKRACRALATLLELAKSFGREEVFNF